MLMILLLHVNFKALGCPSMEELQTSTAEAVVRIAGEAFTVIAVNVFVLISGWFGIHFKMKRFLELVFQIFFICFAVDLFLYFDGRQVVFSFNELKDLLLLNDGGYWFVRAYMVLYILSPILNAFVESASRLNLRNLLILLFIVQTIQGFLTHNGWYDYGYSPLFFVFLYLFGRYIRLYPFKLVQFNKSTDFVYYLCFSLLNVVATFAQILDGWKSTLLHNYMSPFTIVASIYFFLIFTKMHFSNKAINWVAISSLSVYLLHGQAAFLDNIYCANIQKWVLQCSHSSFVFHTLAMILFLFTVAILLDKVRIEVWKGVLFLFAKSRPIK